MTNPTNPTDHDRLTERSRDLADQAKDASKGAMRDASDAAKAQAEAAKSSAADEVSNVSEALRAAADKSRSGSPQERTFGQIAEGLADASDAMRDKDLGEMVNDLNRFARKNPVAFLGGAALIGFAATRFAKASSSPSHDTGGGSSHSSVPRTTPGTTTGTSYPAAGTTTTEPYPASGTTTTRPHDPTKGEFS
ncbi:hypothetical protein [Palleronia sediminis]|uniref:hypothetical protein n=1 Tax=Palleronia sediminis TaxID=2547833 RepID=UPI00197ED5B4|nr:hypothetical protein [Palleronia sediminis]